jgi:hypothetical protein
MTLKSFIDASSLTGIGLQGVLAVVLVGRKAWKRYPLFTIYSLFALVGAVTLYLLQGRRSIFFYSYWIEEAIAIVLGFGVVYEIFQHLFSAHKALLKLARLIFHWTVVALFCVAVSVVLVQAPVASMLRNGVLIFEEATRVVEVGLLMFLFAASAAFGLHWKQAEFGIALGLGLFVAVELTAVTLRSQFAAQSTWNALNLVRILAFNTSLLVWLGYLLAPERVTSNVVVPKRAQLEQWNQAVTELISR